MANSTADSSFSTYGFENELSGYKAINGAAIFSIVMGVASLLMFVDTNFFFVPLLAVVFGALALRRIKKFPEVYTGLKMAQAGIGLSVLFSLVAFSIGFAYQFNLNKDAQAYADSLADVIKSRRPEELLFLKVPESQRGDLTPDKLIAQRMEGGVEGKMSVETDLKPLKQIVADRESPGASLAFDQIELAGYDKLTPFAFLRYSISGGSAPHEHKEGEAHDHKEGDGHDHKEGEAHVHKDGDGHEHKEGDGHDHSAPTATASSTEPKYLMIQIKGEKHKGKNAWYISDIVYPYKKGTATPKVEAVDDGHGHAH